MQEPQTKLRELLNKANDCEGEEEPGSGERTLWGELRKALCGFIELNQNKNTVIFNDSSVIANEKFGELKKKKLKKVISTKIYPNRIVYELDEELAMARGYRYLIIENSGEGRIFARFSDEKPQE